jgi:hypothetical protein
MMGILYPNAGKITSIYGERKKIITLFSAENFHKKYYNFVFHRKSSMENMFFSS